ncbi:MAG TPA: PAS domain-containing protein, partial [Bacteroidota bacterium]|nr:PAS domain-containing protein [Bacteroidota bacterium]
MKNEKMLNQEAGNSKGIDASVLGRTPAAENDVNEYTSELQAVNALLKEEIEVRKNAEKALHRSQDEFRFLFDTMVHGVIVQDADSTIIETNDAACEILGLTKDQFLGKTTYDPRWKLIHEDGSPLTPAEMPSNIALRTGKPVVDVLIGAYIPERDTYHWILTSSTPKFRDDEQQPYLTMTTFTNITERKQIEQERQGHLRFFECMDQINRAIQSNNNVEQMMSDVLDQVLSIFDCDRVFLLYPCDPATPTWTVPMERTKPEYPGVGLMGTEVPMDPDVARTIELLLSADGPLQFGPGTPYPLPAEVSKRYGFKSLMSMVLYPKVGSPWQFGIHYCAQEVVSSTEDVRLFREIGRRLSDALMWKGETEMVADSVVQTFAGNRRNVTVYVSVCPGFEKTLSKVLVSLVDITERKLVENALLRSEAILNEAQRIGRLGSWEL